MSRVGSFRSFIVIGSLAERLERHQVDRREDGDLGVESRFFRICSIVSVPLPAGYAVYFVSLHITFSFEQ